MTYHISLTNLFKQPNLNARQARWTAFLSEIDFEIRHLKRKENHVIDALSIRLHYVYEISYSQVEFNFYKQIKEAALKDPKYAYLWKQA